MVWPAPGFQLRNHPSCSASLSSSQHRLRRLIQLWIPSSLLHSQFLLRGQVQQKSTCRFPGSRTFSPQSCCGDRDRCQVRTVNFQEAGTFSLDPGAIQYVALINFNFFRISLGFPEENLSGEWKFFFLRRAEVRGKEIYVSFVSSGILFRISFRNWSTGANLVCHLRRLHPASLSGIFL